MEPTPRLQLMNWIVSQGLTGLAENDLLRGFCERCNAAGLGLSRALVFIDTLHPIFEGRGFRWSGAESNESESFEYRSAGEGAGRAKLAPLGLLPHARAWPRPHAHRSRRQRVT